MARMRSRSDRVDGSDPTPFDEVFRRVDQADRKLERAVESDEYQAVGMHLRESLISLIDAMRRRAELPAGIERPQDANFLSWSDLLMNHLCSGGSNKELRQHLKNIAKETWQLVNWLTHDRNANETAASVAIHSCQTTIGHFVQILERSRTDKTEQCRSANRAISGVTSTSPFNPTVTTIRVAESAAGPTIQIPRGIT